MEHKALKSIRVWLGIFMVSLFISGLTAIPVDAQLSILTSLIRKDTVLYEWLYKALAAYREVNARFPFLLYGYDWLAFAHFVLALLFIGPYHDPVRNIWVLRFGLIACFLVIPYAFIAGHFRGIPLGWRLIDCTFGVVGALILGPCYLATKRIETKLLQTK
ncbi:MAG TPA: hypothetical protein VHK91_04570 [Flavisolibacter sp.]|jgi:hypothetical protein|nr:hypothetical protein [Flavisolibacter sp.]